MIYIVQNALPILLAGAAGLLVLGLWFGRRGDAPERQRAFADRARRALPVAVVAVLWLAAILAGALILAPVTAGAWTVALGSAFIIWVGFVFPSLLVTLRVRGSMWSSALGDSTAWLAAMLVMAAVLRAVGVSAP